MFSSLCLTWNTTSYIQKQIIRQKYTLKTLIIKKEASCRNRLYLVGIIILLYVIATVIYRHLPIWQTLIFPVCFINKITNTTCRYLKNNTILIPDGSTKRTCHCHCTIWHPPLPNLWLLFFSTKIIRNLATMFLKWMVLTHCSQDSQILPQVNFWKECARDLKFHMALDM